MKALLEIDEGTSFDEIKKAYNGKRLRYLNEKNSTSAKLRIRLLQDKIERLDYAYNEYIKLIESEKGESTKNKNFSNETKTADESRGLNSNALIDQPLDSLQKIKVYPIISVNGQLIGDEIVQKLYFMVDDKETLIEQQGFFELSPGKRNIMLKDKRFTPWETRLNIECGNSMPLIVNLREKTGNVKIDITPKVDFRIFLNQKEIQRTVNDNYSLPIWKENKVLIRAKGFKDKKILVNSFSNKNGLLETTLTSLPENTDIAKGDFPLKLKHTETGNQITLLKGNDFTLGRGKSCCVNLVGNLKSEPVINELFISRNHFTIKMDAGEVFLEDLSSNGTFLNGKKIKFKQVIPFNESLEISIFHPTEKCVLIKKILRVHKIIQYCETKGNKEVHFISLCNVEDKQKKISHLLLLESFANLRNKIEGLTFWISTIMGVIGEDHDNYLHEANLWKIQQ